MIANESNEETVFDISLFGVIATQLIAQWELNYFGTETKIFDFTDTTPKT